jgi:hypothetical protein
MAEDTGGIDYSAYDPETLKATFLETRERLGVLRHALQLKGYWIDAKYQMTPIDELEDTHIASILKMMKNRAILKAKNWKGLEEREWGSFIVEEPVYSFLFTEATDRNLPGINRFPKP